MKIRIKKILNMLLQKRGLALIKKYELDHRDFKYSEAINELTLVFNKYIDHLPIGNSRRSYLLSKLYGTQLSEALYIIYYLNKSKKIEGDVCEFGCANGATSALIANELRHSTKKLWLFDSFEGLSLPSEKDKLINDMFNLKKMNNYKGTMSYQKNEVISRLRDTKISEKRYKIIKGFIEKSINSNKLPNKISFSFIDFDLYEPIKIALDYNNKHLLKGGYIIVDDYEYFSSGVKQAVGEFLSENKYKYKLLLPEKFAGHFCILKKIK